MNNKLKYYKEFKNISELDTYIDEEIGISFFESFVDQKIKNIPSSSSEFKLESKYIFLYKGLLEAEIKELWALIEDTDICTNTIKTSITRTIVSKIDDILYKTIIFEANREKQKGISFQEYLNMTGLSSYQFYFFNKYSELYRIVTVFLKNAVKYFIEIITNINKDYALITKEFGEISKIKEINIEFGDAHVDQKSTARIKCENRTFFYKPRGMKKDIIYNELLEFILIGLKKEWSNTHVLIDCGLYGYQTEVTQGNINQVSNISTYFINSGIVLSLAYVLNLKDLHHENIIATKSHPVLIDLEVMLSGDSGDNNVLQTGLLPAYSFYDINVAGFGNMETTTIEKKNYKIIENNDTVELGNGDNIVIEIKKNSLLFDNYPQYYNNYVNEIISGFNDSILFIKDNEVKFKEIFNEFLNLKTRILIDNTALYNKILGISLFPEFVISIKNRILILLKGLPTDDKVSIAENQKLIISLLNLEIPIIHETINVRWEDISLKLNNIETQVKLIENSFFFEKRDRERYMKDYQTLYPSVSNYPGLTNENYISIVDFVIKELLDNVLIINDEQTWVRPIETEKSTISVSLDWMDDIYYDGRSGVLDFLCDSYKVNSTIIKIELIEQLYDQILRTAVFNANKNVSIGFYQGYTGIVYVLLKAGKILNKNHNDILDSLFVNKSVDSLFYADELDIFTGYSGYLLGLIRIKSLNIVDTRLEENIYKCVFKITKMLENYKFDHKGFAHGNIGVSTVLIDTLKHLDHETQLVVRAALLKIKQDSKKELVAIDGDGWCHGIAGEIIMQCKIRENKITELYDDKLLVEYQKKMLLNFGKNISLCHGDIGNLLILEQSLNYNFDEEVEKEIAKVKMHIIKNFSKDWFLGYGYFVGLISLGVLGLNEYQNGKLELPHLNFGTTK